MLLTYQIKKTLLTFFNYFYVMVLIIYVFFCFLSLNSYFSHLFIFTYVDQLEKILSKILEVLFCHWSLLDVTLVPVLSNYKRKCLFCSLGNQLRDASVPGHLPPVHPTIFFHSTLLHTYIAAVEAPRIDFSLAYVQSLLWVLEWSCLNYKLLSIIYLLYSNVMSNYL